MSQDSETLFSITSNHLNTGLRGVPVGTCRTSRVCPEAGVSYVGYANKELAYLDPEAVIYLLLNRDLPTAEQLVEAKTQLKSRRGVPASVIG